MKDLKRSGGSIGPNAAGGALTAPQFHIGGGGILHQQPPRGGAGGLPLATQHQHHQRLSQSSAVGGGLQYYPEEVSFASLPPLPAAANNRLSSFHHTETLVHIREGEIGGVGGSTTAAGEAAGANMPTPMPPMNASYKNQQRYHLLHFV